MPVKASRGRVSDRLPIFRNCRRLNLSVYQLARDLDLDYGSLLKVAKGQQDPTFRVLVLLCERFNCSADEFLPTPKHLKREGSNE